MENHKFHLAQADQLSLGQPILLHMLWYSSGGRRALLYPETRRIGSDNMSFINLFDCTGKLLCGCWLPHILEPYQHWQFGFTVGRGGSDCLAVRHAVWERAYRAGWR